MTESITHPGDRPLPGVEWRKIASHPRYEVSNDGQIRNGETGRVLRPHPNQKGYLLVGLGRDSMAVHTAVAYAFLGERPGGHQINHKDCVKTHNLAENLEYVTPSENIRHAFAHGMFPSRAGASGSRVRLSEADAIAIRLAAETEPYASIAPRFGISLSQVYNIAQAKQWAHLGLPVRKKNTHIRRWEVRPATPEGRLEVEKAVLSRLASGEALRYISRETGMSRRTIKLIRAGQTWSQQQAQGVA